MSARAPQAIQRLWADIHAKVPRAVLSGIVGDVNHSFGYHLARNQLPRTDYSVQLAADREGASDCASALDVSLPPDLMKTITQRLVTAARSKDPRLKALREFCGTLNGSDTYPWQLTPINASEGVGSWDDSHLWHIHLSFLRKYADNYNALAPIADVFAGLPKSTHATPAKPVDPLEEVMAMYPTKAAFEAALDGIVQKRVKAAIAQINEHTDAQTGKLAHSPDFGLDGIAAAVKSEETK